MGTDVAVIGGGIAGLNAARAAAEHGARVILVDDGDAKPEISNLQFSNLTYWPRSTCLGIYAPGVLGIVTPGLLATLKAKQIILAPGARDALPLFADNDLPGVMSARLVERLLMEEGVASGSRTVVWGANAPARRVGDLMTQAAIQVIRQLADGERIVAVKGAGLVQAAVMLDSAGLTQTVHCDLIVIAALQPQNELLAQAGGELTWDESRGGLVAARDRTMQSSVPGVYVVGEAAGSADAQLCAVEGRLAGLAAARRLGLDVGAEVEALADEVPRLPREASFPFPRASARGAGHVCFCEDVREGEIRSEMDRGYGAPELVKRRTGVVTGPCQGKFCLSNAMRVMGRTHDVPTARPPAKPIRLGELAAKY